MGETLNPNEAGATIPAYVNKSGFSVLREGLALRELSSDELRMRYEIFFGHAPKSHLTDLYITKKILWRIQELRYGGITKKADNYLDEIVVNDPLANLQPAGTPTKLRTCGAQIKKKWHDKLYTVTVTKNCHYEFEGRIYKSLSAVAKEITGAHWNGKVFFGVK